MTYYVSSYFSTFAPYGWSKDAKALAVVLTVPDRQDCGMVDNNGFLTRKKCVRFRGWTEIAECNASTASVLVECEPCEDKNCFYRPSVGETAGARYKEWLEWYLSETDCLLCKNGCQFWWGICVERGWSTPTSEVTLESSAQFLR